MSANWINVKNGKLVMADNFPSEVTIIAFDFKQQTNLRQLMTAVMGCESVQGAFAFRYACTEENIEENIEATRKHWAGEDNGGDGGNDDEDAVPEHPIEQYGFKEWLAWPLLRLLEKLIDWCGVKV